MPTPLHGLALLGEIDSAAAARPRLWWLGRCGFVLKHHDIIFYLDPHLSSADSPFPPDAVTHADMILCSHAHQGHLDPLTVRAMLASSTRAKVILPKSAAADAQTAGIEYSRMTTTDNGLRVEYFKKSSYVRVYAVPSAHPDLDHTPLGGYPYLGYLIRCGDCTFYHAGDCVPYEGLADRLRPYNVTVAMLPVAGGKARNFTAPEAAQLASAIGARWLVPMHHTGDAQVQPFLDHMLFHCPEQHFKVFQRGEGWQVPPVDSEA